MFSSKPFVKLFLAVVIVSCDILALSEELYCPLESVENLSFPSLLQEREEALLHIAPRLAKYLEIPFLPDKSDAFLAGTIGILLNIISAEKEYAASKDVEGGNSQLDTQNLAQLVQKLRNINTELFDFEKNIALLGSFQPVKIPHFISAIQSYARPYKHRQSLENLFEKLNETMGQSKHLLVPRSACHLCLGVGVSKTKYKYLIKSPLFYNHTYKFHTIAPKFGVACGAGSNGFALTDKFIDQWGQAKISPHPDHPLGMDRVNKVTTFNWEGSFMCMQGAVNHQTHFGTGGVSVLLLGFSIGPEFMPEISEEKLSRVHDSWKFYGLFGIKETLY